MMSPPWACHQGQKVAGPLVKEGGHSQLGLLRGDGSGIPVGKSGVRTGFGPRASALWKMAHTEVQQRPRQLYRNRPEHADGRTARHPTSRNHTREACPGTQDGLSRGRQWLRNPRTSPQTTESEEGGDRAACREGPRAPQKLGGLLAELGGATGLGGQNLHLGKLVRKATYGLADRHC